MNDHTDITIILDRSGSMARVASDTIGGFNRFLEDQRRVPGTGTLSLHQFDDVFETPIDAKPLGDVPPLTRETFVPRGNTALLDAIGRGINTTGARLSAMPERERPSKVVFVIITDGAENASTKFTNGRIHDMIKEQRTKYSWEFVFLGANQDAIAVAAQLHIPTTNAMTYAANKEGTQSAFASMSRNTASYRCGGTQSMAFSQADRDEQDDAGAGIFKKNP